ncbi:MAG TPA: IPT/TIG domain-containing protein, partial [Anaerolineales bacterium]|nr:IPT/TIG domain-containing protein [Anaerolineales bacterium]
GSWTTPVVGTLSPARVNTPASAFTLSGENFYGTPIVTVGGLAAVVTIVDAEHLYVTLPPGLGYGWHRVMVTNPDGATTAAPQALQVGATQLTLPTMLRSAFPGWP